VTVVLVDLDGALMFSLFPSNPQILTFTYIHLRAFDHMLCFLKRINPEIDGLDGDEYNLLNRSDPSSQKFQVSFDAPDNMEMVPGHEVTDTNWQLWGEGLTQPGKLTTPSMTGSGKRLYISRRFLPLNLCSSRIRGRQC